MNAVACPDCDLLQQLPALRDGEKASCTRCNHILATTAQDSFDRPLALTLAAAITLIVANTSPLMGISAVGRKAGTTIIGGAYQMWQMDQPLTALVVAFCAVIAPGLYLLCTLVVLLAVRQPPAPHWVGEVLRVAHSMTPWAMLEVMLLGILVALIKIAELAMVDPGIGLFAVGALVVLIPAIAVTFDPEAVWRQIMWDSDEASTAREHQS